MEDTAVLLGKLLETTEGLRRDIEAIKDNQEEERRDSSNSRRAVHKRIDEVRHEMSEIGKTLVAVGGLATQARDLYTVLDNRVTDEVMPAVVTINDLNKQGRTWLTAAGFVGSGITATVGAVVWANWNAIWTWVKATF